MNYSTVQTNVTASHMTDREYQVSVFCIIKFTRQGFENACSITKLASQFILHKPRHSTRILETEPCKFDIKRCEPGILFVSLQVGPLFKLAIVT